MKKLLKFSFLAIVLSIFAFGCQTPTQPDEATGKDVRAVDYAVSDVFAFATSETDGNKATLDTIFDTETTIEGDIRTTTITFDGITVFPDGIIRGGQIIIVWEIGWLWDTTKTTTVTFNDFSRNGDVLSGTLELSFLRGNIVSGTKPTHEIVSKNMLLVYAADAGTVAWEGTRTVVWEAGIVTIRDKSDDVKLVNFNKDGTNRNGEHFIAEGVDLRVDNTCDGGKKARVVSGIFTITKDDGVVTTIDFGDGECDNSFTVTQNGVTVTITPED